MSKAEKTKQYIIEKTAPIFNVKGFAGTSINDITQATGLTKGSIYGNFKNKDDVALAAFDHNLKMVHKMIRHEMEHKDSVKDKLLVYVKVYSNFLEFPFPDGGCPILNTSTEADDTHPELRQKAANAIIQWKDNLQALIQTGLDRGEFRADAEPEQTAVALIAMIEGGIMMAKVTGKLNYRNAVMQSIEKMINDLS